MQRFYILRAEPWREDDWLLDILTEQTGRMRVQLNRPSTPPDLFHCYAASWTQAELPTLKGWHLVRSDFLQGKNLFCGFYVNELLVRLLPEQEAVPALYSRYQHTLTALTEAGLPDPWLRLFEWQLLQNLGYGFSWQLDALGQAICAHKHYAFMPKLGFSESALGFLGADILAFARGENALPLWQMAKKIMRAALDDILEQPLLSRELLQWRLP
ncbi:MAG: hypothetical protein RL217_13 [Pseudomonadota bacterium]|jgi:DNA repair protein RecO (recombination protein O)